MGNPHAAQLRKDAERLRWQATMLEAEKDAAIRTTALTLRAMLKDIERRQTEMREDAEGMERLAKQAAAADRVSRRHGES